MSFAWFCESCGRVFDPSIEAEVQLVRPVAATPCPECGRSAIRMNDRSDVMEPFQAKPRTAPRS